MKQKIFTATAAVLALIAFVPLPMSAQSAFCQRGVYEDEPSEEMRTIEADGFKFDIPENYRAEASVHGFIDIYTPDEYQFVSCLRARNLGAGFDSILVERSPAVVKGESWPYDIPNGDNYSYSAPPNYGYAESPEGRRIGIVSWWSDYADAMMLDAFHNLDSGGSVRVSGFGSDMDILTGIVNSIRE